MMMSWEAPNSCVENDNEPASSSSFFDFFLQMQKMTMSQDLFFFLVVIHKGTTCHAQDLM